jgi:hypothetical protein
MIGGPRLFAEQFLVPGLQGFGLLLPQSLYLLLNFPLHDGICLSLKSSSFSGVVHFHLHERSVARLIASRRQATPERESDAARTRDVAKINARITRAYSGWKSGFPTLALGHLADRALTLQALEPSRERIALSWEQFSTLYLALITAIF